jgi:phytanoyl-CoA hydroxylase
LSDGKLKLVCADKFGHKFTYLLQLSSSQCKMADEVRTSISDAEYEQFCRDGYLVLGRVISTEALAELNQRLDDIMLGKVQYGEKLLMQVDPNAPDPTASSGGAAQADGAGEYLTPEAELAKYRAANVEVKGQTVGFKGPTLGYRKIGEAEAGLECDDKFLGVMQLPLMRQICDRTYGAHAPVAVYRAMVMSKPAADIGGGSPLPWHQDGGDWWALDRDPLCFVWMAMTDATKENGAVQAVKGTHKLGILSKRGHTLSADKVAELVDAHPENVVDLELKAGHAVLCHNWLVHRSSTNTTPNARRGFSVNYIDARTRVLDPKPALAGSLGTPGGSFPLVFPSPYAAQ